MRIRNQTWIFDSAETNAAIIFRRPLSPIVLPAASSVRRAFLQNSSASLRSLHSCRIFRAFDHTTDGQVSRRTAARTNPCASSANQRAALRVALNSKLGNVRAIVYQTPVPPICDQLRPTTISIRLRFLAARFYPALDQLEDPTFVQARPHVDLEFWRDRREVPGLIYLLRRPLFFSGTTSPPAFPRPQNSPHASIRRRRFSNKSPRL